MDCELCKFNNPKGTTTAVIIKDGKLLVLKRLEEPFKDMWDLPGGYMHADELPEESLKRELKEELGSDANLTFIGWFVGTATWQDQKFSVLSHAFLAELTSEIKLNRDENAEYEWQPINDIISIAFDSNQKILEFVKKKMAVDIRAVKELIPQLDNSANIDEQNFYKALLNGYVSKKFVDGKFVGMGWIFPRQTLLRRQAVIEDMIVDDSQRGKGFGEEIVLDLLHWAKENNMEMVELTSGSHRIPANKLYQKVGFVLHPTNHYLYKVQ